MTQAPVAPFSVCHAFAELSLDNAALTAAARRGKHHFVGAKHLSKRTISKVGWFHGCYACGRPESDPDHDGDIDSQTDTDSDTVAPSPVSAALDPFHNPRGEDGKFVPNVNTRLQELSPLLDAEVENPEALTLQRKARMMLKCADNCQSDEQRRFEYLEFAHGYLSRITEFINLPGPGNDHEARSERAKKQLRDKHGKWILMHSHVIVNSPFSGETFTGQVTSLDTEKGLVHVKLDGVSASIALPPENIEAVQAVLHSGAAHPDAPALPPPTGHQHYATPHDKPYYDPNHDILPLDHSPHFANLDENGHAVLNSFEGDFVPEFVRTKGSNDTHYIVGHEYSRPLSWSEQGVHNKLNDKAKATAVLTGVKRGTSNDGKNWNAVGVFQRPNGEQYTQNLLTTNWKPEDESLQHPKHPDNPGSIAKIGPEHSKSVGDSPHIPLNEDGEIDDSASPPVDEPLADWEKELLGVPTDESKTFDATNWKKIGEQGGSNPGGTYEAPDGSRWYVKIAQSDDHAHNEVLASAMYRELGINVPEVLTGKQNGKTVIGSRLVPGAQPNLKSKLSDPKYKAELQQGFMSDSWLANWDVAGLVYDNVVTGEDGKPWRIDTGGSLLFRAMGTPKGGAFGDTVGEIETLRNPDMNPTSANVFSGMTDQQLKDQAQHLVSSMTDTKIAELVNGSGFSPENKGKLIDTLKNRRDYIANKYGISGADITVDENHPEVLKVKDGVFANELKAGDNYYGLQKVDVEGGHPDGSVYHVDKVENFGNGFVIVHTTDEHGNPDLTEFNHDQVVWKTPAATTKPWSPEVATGNDTAPGLSQDAVDNEPYQLGHGGAKIKLGDKVMSTTDGKAGTVVKLEPNGLYVKVKMDQDGKIKGRKASTLKHNPATQPEQAPATPSPAAPDHTSPPAPDQVGWDPNRTPKAEPAAPEEPPTPPPAAAPPVPSGKFVLTKKGEKVYKGSQISFWSKGSQDYVKGDVTNVVGGNSPWLKVTANGASVNVHKDNVGDVFNKPEASDVVDMNQVHNDVDMALINAENHDKTWQSLDPHDLLDALKTQDGAFITVKPASGYETNLKRSDVEALVKEAGLTPPPTPTLTPTLAPSATHPAAGFYKGNDDHTSDVTVHPDGSATVHFKNGVAPSDHPAGSDEAKNVIKNATSGTHWMKQDAAPEHPATGHYTNPNAKTTIDVHPDGSVTTKYSNGDYHNNPAGSKEAETTISNITDSSTNWVKDGATPSSAGPGVNLGDQISVNGSKGTVTGIEPDGIFWTKGGTAYWTPHGTYTKIASSGAYPDKNGASIAVGDKVQTPQGPATVTEVKAGTLVVIKLDNHPGSYTYNSKQLAKGDGASAATAHPNEPPQINPVPAAETYTPKPGEKSIPGNGHVPIYKGSKVKSLKDGMEGEVVTLESNGTYVKVKGADGKIRGRKASTLEVVAHPNGSKPNHADALNATSITDTNVAASVAPELQKYVGAQKPEMPKAPVQTVATAPWVPDTWLQKVKDRYSSFSPGKKLEDSNNWNRVQTVINSGDLDALKHLLTRSYIDQGLFDEAKSMIDTKKKEEAAKLIQHNADMKAWQKELSLWNKANGVKGGIFDPENFALQGMDGARDWSSNAQGTQWAKKVWPGASYYQGAALQALKNYSGTSSYTNPDLWAKKAASKDPKNINQATKNVDAAMEQAPRVPEDIIVRRGTHPNEFVDLNGAQFSSYASSNFQQIKGTIQTNWGFCSTSVATKAAFNSYPVQMNIRVPKGYKAAYMHANGISSHSEYELLLDRGGNFYIHDVKMVNGHWIVDAELVPDGWPPDDSIPVLSSARFLFT